MNSILEEGAIQGIILKSKDGDTITLTVSELRQLKSQLDLLFGDVPKPVVYPIPTVSFPEYPITYPRYTIPDPGPYPKYLPPTMIRDDYWNGYGFNL